MTTPTTESRGSGPPGQAFAFNLLDEPWITCILDDASVRALGLRETLIRADEIVDLTDPSPLVQAALYRFLLAVVHRVVQGPKRVDDWERVWNGGRFDVDAVNAYLDRWRHRFDLFDSDRPFYQTAAVDLSYAGPVALLALERASGNNATLFDHSYDQDGASVPPAAAVRQVLAHQGFALGGTGSHEQGRPQDKYMRASALVNGAVGVVKGESLFATLLLNLQRYDGAAGFPFHFVSDQDAPAWEQAGPATVETKEPLGYLDLLTLQTRRIRLRPEPRADGQSTVVTGAVVMNGRHSPDTPLRADREQMVAFRTRPKAKPEEAPSVIVGFQENRAMWRNAQALVEATDQFRRPRILDWLDMLRARDVLKGPHVYPLDLYGLTADKAKPLLWRHERLPLPLVYLDKDRGQLVARLGEALGLAEHVEQVVAAATRTLAKLMLAPASDQPGGRTPDKTAVSELARSLNPTALYWARLEGPFRQLVVALPEDVALDGDVEDYGAHELPGWRKTVRYSARKAFRTAQRAAEGSGPRGLKAAAVGSHEFEQRLAGALNLHPSPKATATGAAAPVPGGTP